MPQTKSASSLNRLAISLVCAALVGAGASAGQPAIAQSAGASQVSSLETEVTYSEQTLQSFAAAAAGVLSLRGRYYPRIRAAEIAGSKDKADLLFEEMREHMHAAIRNAGFSSEQYRAISSAAKTDTVLRQRINAILQGPKPARRRIKGVARVGPKAPQVDAAPIAPVETTSAVSPSDDDTRQRLEAELSKVKADRDRAQAEQIALQKKTMELERQLAAAKVQAQAKQKKSETEQEALLDRVTNLKHELTTVQSRDSALRDQLETEKTRADAAQSSKEAKLAAFRQEIKGLADRLATAQQSLGSLAVELKPGETVSAVKRTAPFEALVPLHREPNSIERVLERTQPQYALRQELDGEIARNQKERLRRKVERAVLQREIAELSRDLAATYQAMAELIGEPINIAVAATDLDNENGTYALDVSQETAQLFEIAPERFAQAPADPQAEILVDEPLPLGGGNPVNEPRASEPAPGAALEPGLTTSLRANPTPKIQIATVPAPANPAENAAGQFAGRPVADTSIDSGTPVAAQTPDYSNNVLGGAMAYEAADFRRAYKIWAALAESGDPSAQFHLGALYFEGRGTDINFGQAHFWLQVSAYQGNQRARSLLGTVAEKLTGDEIGASKEQARDWLDKRSIEVTQFEPDSQNRL